MQQGWNPGGLLSDIFQTGKDIFVSREYTKRDIERQAAAIQTEKTLQESAAMGEAIKTRSMTTSMIYIGVGLVGIALFIGIWRQIT